MLKISVVLITLLVIASCPLAEVHATVVWSEDFESYEVGSGLIGQGGWDGWFGNPVVDAFISDLYAHGGSKSVEVVYNSDVLQQFTDCDEGLWEISVWIYVPLDFEGTADFVMQNTYPAYNYPDWSVDVRFEGDTNTVGWYGMPEISLPLIRGEWVQLRDEIDLDNDTQTFWYGANVLAVLPWTSVWEPGGAANIATVNLVGAGGTPVYYDDFELEWMIVPNERASWSAVKSLFR